MNEVIIPKKPLSQQVGAEDTARLTQPVPDPSTEGQVAHNPSLGVKGATTTTTDRLFKMRPVLQQVRLASL